MRHAWIAATLALSACSQDPPAHVDVAPADAHLAQPDARVDDLAPGPDGVATAEVTPADIQAPVLPPPATLPPWLVGTWRDCSGTLVLNPAGSWTWQDAGANCGLAGTATMTDGSLDLAVDPTTCALPPWVQTGLGVARHQNLLTMVHPGFQAPRTFATGPVDRQRWLVEDNQGDIVNLDLCFTEVGTFYTGKWKTLQGCGFLACGGVVDGLQVVGGAWQLWTHCSGTCACSGLIVVPIHTADSLSGTFSSASCMNATTGTFSATRQPFP
jgi:hypothetical protein